MIGLQPNSRDCFVCGLMNPFGLKLRFYQAGPGEVMAEIVVPAHFQGYPGVVHGGVITAILDEALGRALMGTDPELSRFMYTASIEVRFRRTVPVEQLIHLKGYVIKERTKFIQAGAKILNPAGEILAEAEGLLVNVPPDMFDGVVRREAGWRIYELDEKKMEREMP